MKLYRLVLLSTLLTLTACAAPGLQGPEMTPKMSIYDSLNDSHKLDKNIVAGTVIADKGMGGLIAPITSDQYHDAIVSALRQAGWYSATKAQYRLNAHLLVVDQPFAGFSMTVTTKAHYALVEQNNGKTVYEDTLTLPCTKGIADAFDGGIRLRMATACAVSENITQLLRVLDQKF